MRKWIVKKLYELADLIHFEESMRRSEVNALAWIITKDMFEEREPKKRGRPKGRKDSVGPQAAPKKRGRPLGSKNKPKETIQ